MTILFLDDDANRHAIFKRNSIGHEVSWAWTADEAIELLNNNSYDLILLDHDLGGPESENTMIDGAKDGRHVATYLAVMIKDGKHKGARILVHSLNRPAACEMCHILNDVGAHPQLWPFAWTKEPSVLL